MGKIKQILILILLLVLSLVFALPSLRSGLHYSFGIGFWGPQGHDGIWHLALINHINNPLKIDLPIFAGESLRNYHPFFDILAATISRATTLDTSFVLFQLLPLIISIGIVFVSFRLARKLFRHQVSWILLPLFLVFSNSLGWIITAVRSQSIGGESMFWAMQSPSILFNPPLALSFLLILVLIYLILLPPKLIHFFITFLILSVLPITKAYSAPMAFILYGVYSLHSLQKGQPKPLVTLIVSFFASVGLYTIYNPLSGGIIEFHPLWFVASMLDSPDRLFLPKIASALHSFTSGGQYFKLSLIYLFAIPLFFVGNFGTRILGLFKLTLRHQLHFYLVPPLIISSLIPLLFIQKGTSWNTIQFLYYPLFFSSIFLVNYLDNLKLSPATKAVYITLLIIINAIPSIPTYSQYLSSTAPSYISPSEVAALSFLATQKQGIVLTYPYDPYARDTISSKTGLPIWAYETTSYVPAYSGQTVYMADEMNLNNSGYDWQTRRLLSEAFFKQASEYQDRGFLVNNQIEYIYLTGNQVNTVKLDTQRMSLTRIFGNDEVEIYQVQR